MTWLGRHLLSTSTPDLHTPTFPMHDQGLGLVPATSLLRPPLQAHLQESGDGVRCPDIVF